MNMEEIFTFKKWGAGEVMYAEQIQFNETHSVSLKIVQISFFAILR